MCGLCVVTILGILYINYRVIKIVRGKDPVLVLMLTCLKLSLLWYAIFYGFNARLETKKLICYDKYFYSITGLIAIWAPFMLGIAVVLTFYKWVNYTMILFTVQEKLVIDSRDSTYSAAQHSLAKQFTTMKRVNTAFTAFMSLVIIGVGVYYSWKTCS